MIRWWQEFSLRLRSLLHRRQVDQELDEELQYHLDRQIEQGIASGLDPGDARYAALREMGATTQNKEECRDMRRMNLLEDVQRNVRYGLRTMRNSPGITIVAVVTLALGIGANTALFSVVDVVLLRPLPFDKPDRLVVVFARNTAPSAAANVLRGSAGSVETGLSIADIADFREQSKTTSGLALSTGFGANLTELGEPQRIEGASVSPNFFSLLGVRPLLGRDFSPDEDALAGERSIILGYEFWQKHWRGDPAVVGRRVLLDQASYTIIGIAPSGFQTPHGEVRDLYRAVIPMALSSGRGRRFWSIVARMKADDVGLVRAELTTIAGRLASQYPATNRGFSVSVTPLKDLIPTRIRSGLIALMISVAILLLIACSNIANLLLVRAAGRQREIATRQALGASGPQLIRQFVTENLLIAMLGGALGLLVAFGAIRVLAGTASSEIPRLNQGRVDWRVLAFSAGVTLLSGLFFSLLPIVRALRKDWSQALLQSRSGGTDVKSHRLSNALVVVQMSLAVVLLIEAGLMLRTFQKLQSVDPGFRPEQVIAFQVSMSRAQFRNVEQSAGLFAALSDRLKAVPGVDSVGATLQLPIAGLDVDLTQIALIGNPVPREQEPSARLHVVTPEYFSTLKIPLVRGRFFTNGDGLKAPGVAIVNEAMARKIWGTEDPIGKKFSQRLLLTPGEKPERMVVGIVGNIKHFGLEFTDEAQMYLPHGQSPWPAMYFVVRTSAGVGAIANGLKEAIWSVDRSLPVDKLSAMNEVLSGATYQPRVRAVLVGSFSVTAILLAAIGIYGVVSYRVAQRRREIAIRLAMGAERTPIVNMILMDGVRLALLGAAVGSLLARLAAPAISSLLYGVNPTDPATIGAAAGLCVSVALLACFVPARRASKVDPMVSLRLD
jgi:predicted permease